MSDQSFEEKLTAKVAGIEEILKAFLPAEEGYQQTLLEAMNYSVLAGGKRLRPLMMAEVYQMLGGNGLAIRYFCAAQEMIHTYSLVHDDLPAMDNDEYRRGRKTTHAVYGEAMAILAGDGLLNYAYEVASRAFETGEDPARIGKALQVLTKKAGIYGMVGGQSADVEAEKRELDLDEPKLMFIHENKTAALIQSSLMVGAILAGAGDETISKLEQCGYDIGIAFQIQDDILDVTGNEAELGKPVGSDEKNHKLTYVTAHGLEASAAEVERLSKEAVSLIRDLDFPDPFLEDLVVSLIHRTK